MRKMKTPEVDVIRFNESDVIVASGGPDSVRLAGLGNGQADATLSFMGKTYDYNSLNAAYDAISQEHSVPSNGLYLYIPDIPEATYSNNLFNADQGRDPSSNSVWNGTYTYHSSNGAWYHQ